MSQYHYPRGEIVADYLRAAAGCVITIGPLVFADLSLSIACIFAALGALFLVYGLRTAVRQRTTVEIGDFGIRTVGPMARTIAWSDLTDMSLRYFSTRRDRRNGWMQLKLAGPAGKIRLDSSLNGFNAVTARAARAADEGGLALNPMTLENLRALGIEGGQPA